MRCLGLFNLETGGTISTYNITVCMIGREWSKGGILLPLSHNTGTKAHPMKLTGRRVRADKRDCFFTQGTISMWNSLPQDVVMVTHYDGLKRVLYKFKEDYQGLSVMVAMRYLWAQYSISSEY